MLKHRVRAVNCRLEGVNGKMAGGMRCSKGHRRYGIQSRGGTCANVAAFCAKVCIQRLNGGCRMVVITLKRKLG
jgi:hypothetical protein